MQCISFNQAGSTISNAVRKHCRATGMCLKIIDMCGLTSVALVLISGDGSKKMILILAAAFREVCTLDY